STVEGDAVVVEVVYDYQCPHCANFEAANHADISSLLESGNVQFIFRPVSFMDYASNGKEFSTRASNAAAVVADRSPEYFLDFHGALFANQPTGNGLTDDDIADIAREVGVPQETIDEFTTTAPSSDERVFSRWIAAATQREKTRSSELGAVVVNSSIVSCGTPTSRAVSAMSPPVRPLPVSRLASSAP